MYLKMHFQHNGINFEQMAANIVKKWVKFGINPEKSGSCLDEFRIFFIFYLDIYKTGSKIKK